MRHFLIAIALCGLTSAAAAQPAPWSPARSTAGWVFTPAVTFGAMWDSNVTVRNEGSPTASELVGIVNPRGEIDFNGRRAHFSAGYSGSLEAYREVDELTRYDQRARLDTRYQITPRLHVHAQQRVTITPTTDQLDLGGLPFTRVGSRLADTVGGFVLQVTPRSTVSTSYNFQWVNFDRGAVDSSPDFSFLRGGHTHSPTAEYRYQLTKQLDVGTVWTYRHTNLDGNEQIFDSQDIRGVVEFDISPSTAIRGSAGVAHVNIARTEEALTGPSFSAGISHKVRQVAFNASYDRSLLPSFGFGSLTAQEVFNAGVSSPFASGRMYAGTSFSWRRSDPTLVEGLVRLNSYWWTSTVGFHVARWLKTEAFMALTRQVSNAQGNVERSRIGIQFVTHKPMRIQ
jgi:hypothetical protein